MIKIFALAILLGFPIFYGGGQEPQVRTSTEEGLNLPLILERIAKTSPEGLEVIEKAKRITPVIQKNKSAKTLGATVEESINGQGQFVIYPIGWEALKSDGPRWIVSFYFKDEEQKYLRATWEYNKDRNVLLLVEFTNATKFWVRRSANLNP